MNARKVAILSLWDLYVSSLAASRYGLAFAVAGALRSLGYAVAETAHGGSL